MHRGHEVAVVVPAFNEERLVGETVATLPDWVDRILVVDDASSDATAQVACAEGSRRAGFELLRHGANRGVGAAICTGYRRAREHGCDLTVVVGADRQMDPADLPALLAPLIEGQADYAKGNRLCWPGVREVMPRVRWLGNWALTWLTRPVSGLWHVTDSQCGYTAITRDALARVPLEQLYPRYGYPNDLLAWLGSLRLRVVDVPVRPVYATEASGIRVTRVVAPLLGLLTRSFVRRIRQRLRPAPQLPTPAQQQPTVAGAPPHEPSGPDAETSGQRSVPAGC